MNNFQHNLSNLIFVVLVHFSSFLLDFSSVLQYWTKCRSRGREEVDIGLSEILPCVILFGDNIGLVWYGVWRFHTLRGREGQPMFDFHTVRRTEKQADEKLLTASNTHRSSLCKDKYSLIEWFCGNNCFPFWSNTKWKRWKSLWYFLTKLFWVTAKEESSFKISSLS